MRAHKWHGENQTVMLFNLPQPMGLVAVHPARQPPGMAEITSNPLLNDSAEISKLTLLILCKFAILRWESLLEEYLHSYLPALRCGTEVLLMCLPLRLDTGRGPNHLQQRYESLPNREHSSLSLMKKEVRSEAADKLIYSKGIHCILKIQTCYCSFQYIF